MPHNPRRAYDNDGNEILPLTLAVMREHGVRAIRRPCETSCLVWCNACNHDVTFNADHLPNDLPARDVALRMRCSQCSSKDLMTLPEWWEMEVAE